MKTVCIDLRALQIGHENRGIGMYARSVLEHLPADGNRYMFYAFDKNDPIKALDIKLNFEYELVQTPTIKTTLHSPRDLPGLLRLINHRFKPLKKHRPDVFLQFDFTLGTPRWRGIKKVVIGYDLIPLLMKNQYLPSLSYAIKQSVNHRRKTPTQILRSVAYRTSHLSFRFKEKPRLLPLSVVIVLRSMYYNFKYRQHYKTYRRADAVVCISEATAKDFRRLLAIPKAKVHTTPLAPVLSTAAADFSIAQKIKNPYIFYVGGTDSRKRIQDIVKAFNIARGRGAKLELVFAGNEFVRPEHVPSIDGRLAIIKSAYKDHIHLVGFISDAQKKGLYERATAFLFTTAYEGFGMPILEAMAMDCPVISYNNSSIPEAAGNAALLVETGDFVAIANNILALQDKELRQNLIEAGQGQAKKFSWSKTAEQLLTVIDAP